MSLSSKVSTKTKQKVKKINRNEMLAKLEKALDSRVLNGGFDTLLSKVEQIENCQEHMTFQQKQIADKVESIHDAIYHPDDGIYSRIKSLDASQRTSSAELNVWKTHVDQQLNDDKEVDNDIKVRVETNDKGILSLRSSIEMLEKSHKIFLGVIKWFGVAIGGGAITLALKTVWGLLF